MQHQCVDFANATPFQGANHLYSQFLRPYVLKYEPEIDRRIAELQNGVGTSIANYSQVGTQYIKARFLEVVQYLASQSPRNRAQVKTTESFFHSEGVCIQTLFSEFQVRGRHLRNNLSRRNPQQTPWELDETTEREPAFSPNRYGQVAADEDEDEDEMRDYDVVEPFSADDDLPLNEVPPSGGDDQDQDLDPVVTRRLRSRSRNGRRRN